MKPAVRPQFAILLIISLALALIVFLSVASGIIVRDNVYPSIKPSGDSLPVEITNNFTYKNRDYSVTVQVGKDVLEGAQSAQRSAHIFEIPSPEEILSGYYGAFIFDQAQEEMYDEISAELQKIKDEENLSDSEYVDLMAVFVQSIPYKKTNAGGETGFPVETLAFGGDCDSKSALLTGMLVHEGYNASMLLFPKSLHSATGVAYEGELEFHDSGNIYIETTTISPVGFTPGIVENPGNFYVISFGNGSRYYT